MKLRIMFALGLAVLIAACSTQDRASAAVTAQKTAFTMKSTYAGLLTAADLYARLPRCAAPATTPAPAAPLCSDQNVLNQMVKAQAAAKSGVDAFESASRNITATPDIIGAAQTAATDALAALTKILDTYNIKHG